MLDQFFGQHFGGIEQESSADTAIIFDRLEQLRFMLFAHARQGAILPSRASFSTPSRSLTW